MKPMLLLIRYLWSPTVDNWRHLRRACIERLPEGTFKAREKRAA